MRKIENIHLIEEVFGDFPSFHDAEILRIVLFRESIETLPTLEAQIHVFEMTSEIKDGKYILKNHSLVTFQFLEIADLSLEGFNNQNVLQELFIKDVYDHHMEKIKFEVRFFGNFGVDAQFKCRSIKITNVAPFQNNARTA